ncbi:MAG: hypothetical protein ACI9WU_001851 [Myxococcota bacterium]|jgi:hypothetical protein
MVRLACGLALSLVRSCSGDAATELDGSPVDGTATCTPLAVSCQDDAVWICQPDGRLEWAHDCESGTCCLEGSCVLESRSLVTPESWMVLGSGDDPYCPDRPDGVEVCDPFWTQVRESEPVIAGHWFEIQTGACDYISVAQPIQAEVTAGASLVFQLHHYALLAGDGTYKISARLGDEVVWNWETPPLPLSQTWIEETVVIEGTWPAGTRLALNVTNHGINEWAIYDVLVRQ